MKPILAAAAAALCLSATGADAAIQVLNHSFEDNALGDGDFIFGATNWATARNAGTANPTAAFFPRIPHGQNTAFLGSGVDESGAYGGTMRQTQAETLAANTRYTFSVDVGHAMGLDMADFQVSLIAGGEVVALGAFTNADIAPGQFRTLTLSFDTLDEIFGFEILFETFWNSAQGGAYRQVNFDNARLDAVSLTPGAIPEPATWAMMILGFAGIGATLRTRRKALGLT